ncbi:MAG: hypothetical protein JNK68_00610, partial [Betaproteobacteria bacterium]|nr:hypothetical protein [Betaproteobacteria bacterium]
MSTGEGGFSRRATLKLLAAGSLLAAGGANSARGESTPLLKRAIPRSGELLPAVGLGTYRTFDVGTSREERAPLT